MKTKQTQSWLLFFCIVALYALLIVPTLGRLGMGWDEAVDLRIARGYLSLRGLFLGITLDLSQTRLPIFSVALVYRLLGVDDLLAARWMSVFVGGLTLLGIYVYGKARFSHEVGLLAATLLAVNPFFLSFARLAFTESDVYLACTFTWLLVAIARLQEQPTVGRAAVAGLLLGLCISAKATALVALPIIWVVLLFGRIVELRNQANRNISASHHLSPRVVLLWAGWAIFVFLIGVYVGGKLNSETFSIVHRALHYGLVCLGWLVTLSWAFRFRNHTVDSFSLAPLVTGLGLLTFVIFPPDHLTNSGIIRSLFLRAESEMSFNLAFMGELAALHILVVIFKSTPGLGFGLLSATVASFAQWREQMLPLFVSVGYFAGLLLLPLGQTFYSLAILPMFSLLAANQLMRLWGKRRRLAILISVLAMGWWGMEMIQCYPDYHLNGYQWVGKRVLFGRSSIGYRSIVYTPSDGVQQAVAWLNANAKPGQVAQLYVAPWEVVRQAAPDPAYLLINGLEQEALSAKPDYVVVHINELLRQGYGTDTPEGVVIRYPFDEHILKREYEQVFVVYRAFGLEMASVWQRKEIASLD